MIPLEELQKLQQEYARLSRLHPYGEVFADIYETKGTPINETESEIEKLNKSIKELKIQLDSFGITY